MAQTRNTVQMEKILAYLSGVKSHPNAETVFNSVRKEIPSITLATVYRNLNKLAATGRILRLEVNGEYRFDADTSPHQHGVCNACGRIFDFFDGRASGRALKNFSSPDFSAEKVSITFMGTCKKCMKGS